MQGVICRENSRKISKRFRYLPWMFRLDGL